MGDGLGRSQGQHPRGLGGGQHRLALLHQLDAIARGHDAHRVSRLGEVQLDRASRHLGGQGGVLGKAGQEVALADDGSLMDQGMDEHGEMVRDILAVGLFVHHAVLLDRHPVLGDKEVVDGALLGIVDVVVAVAGVGGDIVGLLGHLLGVGHRVGLQHFKVGGRPLVAVVVTPREDGVAHGLEALDLVLDHLHLDLVDFHVHPVQMGVHVDVAEARLLVLQQGPGAGAVGVHGGTVLGGGLGGVGEPEGPPVDEVELVLLVEDVGGEIAVGGILTASRIQTHAGVALGQEMPLEEIDPAAASLLDTDGIGIKGQEQRGHETDAGARRGLVGVQVHGDHPDLLGRAGSGSLGLIGGLRRGLSVGHSTAFGDGLGICFGGSRGRLIRGAVGRGTSRPSRGLTGGKGAQHHEQSQGRAEISQHGRHGVSPLLFFFIIQEKRLSVKGFVPIHAAIFFLKLFLEKVLLFSLVCGIISCV